MSKDLLIGIDIGTTSAKCALFDAQGTALAQAAREYPTAYPHPNWAEQNPEDWWGVLCTCLPQLFADSGRSADEVAAICVSSQAPTLVPVDAHGNPLHPAIIWMDRRSEPQCDWLKEHIGTSFIAKHNGGRIDPFFLAPKLLWYRDERPDLYRGTAAVLQANGYIVHRLTDQCTMDTSHGPLTLFYDSSDSGWIDEILDRMHVDPSILPPLSPCAEIVGEVTADAAESTGLAAGTPVIAGMVDGTAAALEASLIHTDDAVEMTGQSTVLLICTDHPYRGKDLFPLGHAVPDRYLVVGAQVATGGSLRWFRDQLGEHEQQLAANNDRDPFDVLTDLAAASPPGANRLLFLPYMYGERSPIWDTEARGAFVGLSLASTKGDMVRAIMEGAAFGLRHNVDAAKRQAHNALRLTCVGGAARSPLWNQIKADILQVPIHVPSTTGGAPLGDVILAATAAGLYPNIESAIDHMTRPGKIYEPNPALAARYDALYAVYLNLYPALSDSFEALAAVAES